MLDQQPHLILRGERDRDQLAGRGHLALAHQIERRLHVVRERGDGVEAEHRAGALDGMQRAERRIDQRAVVRRALQIEQRLFQLLEQILRFLQKDLIRIGEVHQPSTFLTMATS